MFIWDIDSSPEFMQWCSEWAIFLNLHTAAEHRVQEGLTKIHYITPILQKEHETLCFSCGRFSSKNRETSQGTSETAPPAGSAWKLSTARQPDICCGSYLDYEEWFENMAGVFFCPKMQWKKLMCIFWHRSIPWKWSLQGHPRTDPFPVSTLSGEGCDAWQSEESLHFFDWKCWSGSCLEPQQFFERMGAKDTQMEKHRKKCKIEAWNRNEHEWTWYANWESGDSSVFMMILTYILHLPQVDVANEAFRGICYQKHHHPGGDYHPVLGG